MSSAEIQKGTCIPGILEDNTDSFGLYPKLFFKVPKVLNNCKLIVNVKNGNIKM